MVASKDVAKCAGVSCVLNMPDFVKPKTMEKVLSAIQELKYTSNKNTRSFVQNRTGTTALNAFVSL